MTRPDQTRSAKNRKNIGCDSQLRSFGDCHPEMELGLWWRLTGRGARAVFTYETRGGREGCSQAFPLFSFSFGSRPGGRLGFVAVTVMS